MRRLYQTAKGNDNEKTLVESYLSVVPLASAARSLCRRFLNQFDTCVTVKSVISANSRFSRGLQNNLVFR